MITLKELTTKFLQRSPQLRDDPLYQALLEQTNNSNVSNSSPPFASVYNSL